MNNTNKKFIIFYLALFVVVFTAIIYIDSGLDRPTRPLNLTPHELSTFSYSETFDVDKEKIFNIFADVKNYKLLLPSNVLSVGDLPSDVGDRIVNYVEKLECIQDSHNVFDCEKPDFTNDPRILPTNIIPVTNTPENQSVYYVILTSQELLGLSSQLKVEQSIEPYDSQVIKVVDGDAQGTIITQTFESYDDKTKISVEIDLKTKGILTPISFMPIKNAHNAVDTIINGFVKFANRTYSPNEIIVDNLYREVLLRPGDPYGLRHYSDALDKGYVTIEEIRNEMLDSEEYQLNVMRAHLKEISELSEDTKNSIDELYKIILRRNADPIGLQLFGSALEDGKMDLSSIRDALLHSQEFHKLPVETRELPNTYRTNEYWQTVKQTYFEESTYRDDLEPAGAEGLWPSAKLIRAYGIFYERGDMTLDEMKDSFRNIDPRYFQGFTQECYMYIQIESKQNINEDGNIITASGEILEC